jgi:hypothetical protein
MRYYEGLAYYSDELLIKTNLKISDAFSLLPPGVKYPDLAHLYRALLDVSPDMCSDSTLVSRLDITSKRFNQAIFDMARKRLPKRYLDGYGTNDNVHTAWSNGLIIRTAKKLPPEYRAKNMQELFKKLHSMDRRIKSTSLGDKSQSGHARFEPAVQEELAKHITEGWFDMTYAQKFQASPRDMSKTLALFNKRERTEAFNGIIRAVNALPDDFLANNLHQILKEIAKYRVNRTEVYKLLAQKDTGDILKEAFARHLKDGMEYFRRSGSENRALDTAKRQAQVKVILSATIIEAAGKLPDDASFKNWIRLGIELHKIDPRVKPKTVSNKANPRQPYFDPAVRERLIKHIRSETR